MENSVDKYVGMICVSVLSPIQDLMETYIPFSPDVWM